MFRMSPNASASSARHPSRIGRAALALWLASALLPLAALAEGTPTTQARPDSLKPVRFLDEVLVTGSRYPRQYFESPQALSFVNRTQIREQMPTAIGDVLQQLPGVDRVQMIRNSRITFRNTPVMVIAIEAGMAFWLSSCALAGNPIVPASVTPAM